MLYIFPSSWQQIFLNLKFQLDTENNNNNIVGIDSSIYNPIIIIMMYAWKHFMRFSIQIMVIIILFEQYGLQIIYTYCPPIILEMIDKLWNIMTLSKVDESYPPDFVYDEIKVVNGASINNNSNYNKRVSNNNKNNNNYKNTYNKNTEGSISQVDVDALLSCNEVFVFDKEFGVIPASTRDRWKGKLDKRRNGNANGNGKINGHAKTNGIGNGINKGMKRVPPVRYSEEKS